MLEAYKTLSTLWKLKERYLFVRVLNFQITDTQLKVHWQSRDFEHLCKKFAEKKGLDWYCWDAIGKYWPEYYQGYSTVYLHMGMSSGKFIVHKLIENIIYLTDTRHWL